MAKDQKIRAVLYYLSVAVFFIGLPFILAFALSYKFDPHTLKFTKTGIISLKTQPAGAAVYLDNSLFDAKTPVTVNELLPGTYQLELQLDGYYPYSSEVEVETGKVTRLEKIILFPQRFNIHKLNKEPITSFWMDEAKGTMYYVNAQENILYRSSEDGAHFKKAAAYMPLTPPAYKWELSPNREYALYFNNRQIGIVNLAAAKSKQLKDNVFVLNFPQDLIHKVFWYADNYHIILVCSKRVLVCEAKPGSVPLTLINLAKHNTNAYFDVRTDTLYFIDSQEAADGNIYDNVYKLELSQRINRFEFQELMRIKNNEKGQKTPAVF